MKKIIHPGRLSGSIPAVPSKSQAHRALFVAAFADEPTRIVCPQRCEDIEATMRAIEMLGAGVTAEGDTVTVSPAERGAKFTGVKTFNCGESGTTLRFVLPMIGVEGCMTEIMTHGRLGYRPLKELGRELSKKGMAFDQIGYAVRAMNKLKNGRFSLPGDISSQYISALLMALPLLEGPSEIYIDGEVSSSSYIDMTLDVMETFGVAVRKCDTGYLIDPACCYKSPGEFVVEGDHSAAAFWTAANALGSDIDVLGLQSDSRQGDRAMAEIICHIKAAGAEVDIDQTPDLLPALAVVAALSDGETRFVNAARLRAKESDRLETTGAMIRALGGECGIGEDSLTVTGVSGEKLAGGTVNAAGDHRIAMSAAIAATVCENEVVVEGAESVAKSYPSFWVDYMTLGGSVTDAEDEPQKNGDF